MDSKDADEMVLELARVIARAIAREHAAEDDQAQTQHTGPHEEQAARQKMAT